MSRSKHVVSAAVFKLTSGALILLAVGFLAWHFLIKNTDPKITDSQKQKSPAPVQDPKNFHARPKDQSKKDFEAEINQIRSNISKSNPPPTKIEIEQYLEKANRTVDGLGWAFVNSGDIAYLEEGLRKYPDDAYIHFLAACNRATSNEAKKIAGESGEWLRQNNPFLYAIYQSKKEIPLTINNLDQINNDLLRELPESILKNISADFLTSIREKSTEFAKEYAGMGVPNDYSVQSELVVLALSKDPVKRLVASIAQAESQDLSTALVGLQLEGAVYRSIKDNEILELTNQNKEQNLQSNIAEIQHIQSLIDYRNALLTSKDDIMIKEFNRLSQEIGERKAVEEIQSKKGNQSEHK